MNNLQLPIRLKISYALDLRACAAMAATILTRLDRTGGI